MKLSTAHLNFENNTRQLLGLTISRVEYSEIDYNDTTPTPYYSTHYRDIDTVDFSIFLYCDNNAAVEIYWDDEFFQFGIGIKIDQPSDFTVTKKWDVTNNSLWKSFIGEKIIDVKIGWETATTIDEKEHKTEHFIYPQDLTITFSNHKNIFVSAAGFLHEKASEVYGMLDNLTVTHNEELAKKVKMIR